MVCWAQAKGLVHTSSGATPWVHVSQFLVSNFGGNPRAVLEFVKRGAVRVEFRVQDQNERLLQLQESYRNVPMSLADACLVCMAEEASRCRVLTTDSHFRVYRRNGRQLIPVLMPDGLA
jgi:hypothetical protein